jgi:hypothetical protein
MTPRRLIRFYPRLWRERYGDEFLALLEASPRSAATTLDVIRGAGREWGRQLLWPGETACPYPSLLARRFGRLFGVAVLSWAIVLVVWPVSLWLHESGLTAPGNGRGLLLGMLITVRGLLAFILVMLRRGPTRVAVGRGEFVLWIVVACGCVGFERLDALEIRRSLWTGATDFGKNQSDLALQVFNQLMFFTLGSRAAAVDVQRAEAWRHRRLVGRVPASPLGLSN